MCPALYSSQNELAVLPDEEQGRSEEPGKEVEMATVCVAHRLPDTV